MLAAAIAPTNVPLVYQGGESDSLRLVDPREDSGWDKRIADLPGVSFFHGAAWANVLCESYGHRPFYIRSGDGNSLDGLLPLMEVASPLTGRRGVSLPFTDLSPVLASDESIARRLVDQALTLGRERQWCYLELRGISGGLSDLTSSVAYLAHRLDLRAGPDALLNGMDQGARRAIRKAQQSGVEIEITRAPEALRLYFRLHCLTRKRHGLPPQPLHFFDNIGRMVVGQGGGFVAIARWMGQPVAGAVFVHSDRHVIYKYGAMDEAFQGMRPNNLLFWQVIQECCQKGFESLHLGRTSLANEGLCRFKRSLGAAEQPLHYLRFHFRRGAWVTSPDRASSPANAVFRCLPVPVLRGLGWLLYRHMS
jgi:CelD/BcsL family acetyltransferase involved in cellulose biosynthesis